MRFKSLKIYKLILGVILSAEILGGAAAVFAAAPEELKSTIEAKANELKKVAEEIEANQKLLEQAEGQRKSLQGEIRQIDNTLKNLTLGIKASGLQIEKLGLEIESLSQEILVIESDIELRRAAIIKLIRELWQKERESLLFLLLKSQSLAEGLAENQNLIDLNQGLRLEVLELKNLNTALSERIAATANKKGSVEIEQRSLQNKERSAQVNREERNEILSFTKNQERVYQDAIAELEKKQAAIGKELAALEDELRVTFDPATLPAKRPGVLGNPVPGAPLTQEYGHTEFAERAYRTKFHNGLDFGARLGTLVVAAADGKVIAVDNNDRGSARYQRYQYGQYVLIEHPNNLTTLYAHLSGAIVKRGDIIKKGDPLGYIGNTGYSFGPHLHFTVYWSPSVRLQPIPPAAGLVPIGVTIDPKDYL